MSDIEFKKAFVRKEYPMAWQSPEGTVWISQESVIDIVSCDEPGLENILGWDWHDAVENLIETRRIANIRARHRAWPRFYRKLFWFRKYFNFVCCFSGLVWRKWEDDYRISWSTAWDCARTICL